MTWKYIGAWFGLMLLAVLNGAVRDLLYKPVIGGLAAHQVSTVILLLLIGVYVGWLTGRWTLRSAGQAWQVGGLWFLMTEVFEFGFGLLRGASWERLLYAYDITEGQVWILIPLWVLTAPFVFFRFVHPRKSSRSV